MIGILRNVLLPDCPFVWQHNNDNIIASSCPSKIRELSIIVALLYRPPPVLCWYNDFNPTAGDMLVSLKASIVLSIWI